MSVFGLTLAAVLAQAAPTVVAPEMSAAEKVAASAERAAVAAQKAAEAATRIADAIAPLPVAPVVDGQPAASPPWVGSLGLGFTFITGNSQTLTITGGTTIDRKWTDWALGIRLSGAVGLANPDTNTPGNQTSTTARRASGTVRGDRTFNSSFASIFVLAGSEFDHMKSIESRTIGEVGTGLTFFNTKQGELEKLYFRLDLAARSGYETRFQYFPVPSTVVDPGIVILAPRAALTFRWNFSKDVRFSEELEFIPFMLAPTTGRLLINNHTKLSARLTEMIALVTAVLVNFDSQPPVGTDGLKRKETDVALTAGLEATF